MRRAVLVAGIAVLLAVTISVTNSAPAQGVLYPHTVSRRVVLSGVEDISAGHSALVAVPLDTVPSRVRLLIVGREFDQAHYTELPAHAHAITGSMDAAGDHTHLGPAHSHQVGSHTHSIPSHSHSAADHTHTLGSHVHSTPNHTHSFNVNVNENLSNPDLVLDLELASQGVKICTDRILPSGGGTTGTASGVTGPGGSGTISSVGLTSDPAGATITALDGALPTESNGTHQHGLGTLGVTEVGVHGSPLSVNRKQYFNDLRVLVDGFDITSTVLAQMGMTELGDGSAVHPFNLLAFPASVSAMVDLTNEFSTVGIHSVEFVQGGTEGGALVYSLVID